MNTRQVKTQADCNLTAARLPATLASLYHFLKERETPRGGGFGARREPRQLAGGPRGR